MPALKDIRRRIGSVKSTQQITKAMKMISAAKLRRAQDSIFAARPYAASMLARAEQPRHARRARRPPAARASRDGCPARDARGDHCGPTKACAAPSTPTSIAPAGRLLRGPKRRSELSFAWGSSGARGRLTCFNDRYFRVPQRARVGALPELSADPDYLAQPRQALASAADRRPMSQRTEQIDRGRPRVQRVHHRASSSSRQVLVERTICRSTSHRAQRRSRTAVGVRRATTSTSRHPANEISRRS